MTNDLQHESNNVVLTSIMKRHLQMTGAPGFEASDGAGFDEKLSNRKRKQKRTHQGLKPSAIGASDIPPDTRVAQARRMYQLLRTISKTRHDCKRTTSLRDLQSFARDAVSASASPKLPANAAALVNARLGRYAAAVGSLRAGQSGSGFKRIVGGPKVVAASEETLAKYQEKTPPAREGPLPAWVDLELEQDAALYRVSCNPDDDALQTITRAQVLDALDTSNGEASPGPTGLSYRHVAQLTVAYPKLPDALASFVMDVHRGLFRAHPEETVWLKGTVGVALDKPNAPNAIRPLAMGETLRKIAATIGARVAVSRLGLGLWVSDMQIGLGQSSASEFGALHVRHEHERGRWIVSIDFKNAYNTLCRRTVSKAVSTYCPALTAYVELFYSAPTAINLGHHTVVSSTGVHQGDPLSSLLFTLGLRPALLRTRRLAPDVGITAYMDDVTLSCPTRESAAHATATLMDAATQVGLDAQPAKCALLVPEGEPLDDLVVYPDRPETNVPATSCIVTCGVAVGDEAGVKAYYSAKVDGVIAQVDAVREFTDFFMTSDRVSAFPAVQWAGYLATTRLMPILTYSMRTTSPAVLRPHLARADAAFGRLALSLMALPDGANLPQSVSAPVSRGGLGLGHLEAIAPAAYLGAQVSHARLVREAGVLIRDPDNWTQPPLVVEPGGMPEGWPQTTDEAMSIGLEPFKALRRLALADKYGPKIGKSLTKTLLCQIPTHMVPSQNMAALLRVTAGLAVPCGDCSDLWRAGLESLCQIIVDDLESCGMAAILDRTTVYQGDFAEIRVADPIPALVAVQLRFVVSDVGSDLVDAESEMAEDLAIQFEGCDDVVLPMAISHHSGRVSVGFKALTRFVRAHRPGWDHQGMMARLGRQLALESYFMDLDGESDGGFWD
ncbi:hypothetical protein J8273_6555 [Carpediemonas membranifera]|uniref:Reverse transcriptase domain-containing protein n=1 Tax=Carpediemonas membranifera TaxID=201153 RepID=A0A8J6BVU9_9EUKA|nr:hypothetical protein J8273_6555 [Carpediemonas membranifera]|eukprot:KAG9391776.1 hypothetical protein J8273_6555 [Carpediemonas membranifera]